MLLSLNYRGTRETNVFNQFPLVNSGPNKLWTVQQATPPMRTIMQKRALATCVLTKKCVSVKRKGQKSGVNI